MGVGGRLAGAFVAVALAAIALQGGLTLLSAQQRVSGLRTAQQHDTLRSVAAALEQGYREAGSWRTASQRPALVLATARGAAMDVRDASGRAVGLREDPMAAMMARIHGRVATSSATLGPRRSVALRVSGREVGTVTLRFASEAGGGAQELGAALRRTALAGSALAALLALLVAAVISRRLTRPLVGLTRAARAMGGGERGARAGPRGPGELGELAQAFDAMAEAVEREDRLRRTLVADVAHELRTPLSIVRGYSEQLADGLTEPTPELLRSLHDEVLRLTRLLEDLSDLASAEAAGLRMDRRRVNLADAAAEQVKGLAAQADDAGIALSAQLTPVWVAGDRLRLGQVLDNLLTNALKFTPHGGRVAVSLERDGDEAQLTVADTGMGISPDELPRVFERFFRGRGASGVSGSGVGLAVARELTMAHGGTLEAVSTEGVGTTFTVRLPAVGTPTSARSEPRRAGGTRSTA